MTTLASAPASAAAGREPRTGPDGVVDLDLHGLVGVRLIGATPRDLRAVRHQLGPFERPLAREPDITITFVDRLPHEGTVRLVGVDEAAYDDDGFFILRGRNKSPLRVRIPFDTIGARCEIVCEHGLAAVPLLLAIINLTVLERGGVALHATAFRWQGRGVLVTGWSKSGKTESLLSFLEHDAEFIGDEWIYLLPGRRMFGIREPVRLWDWQLAQLPHYLRRLPPRDRVRLAALRAVAAALGALARVPASYRGLGIERLRLLIERQRHAFVPPDRLAPVGSALSEGVVDDAFFLVNAETGRTTVAEISPGWIAARMVHSLQEERAPLDRFYRQFRFAFPDRRNPLLDRASALEARRLPELLAGARCHALYHPYPPSIRDLFEHMAPVIQAAPVPTTPRGRP